MAKRNTEKSRRQHLRLILYLIAVIAIAMLIEIIILHSLNKRNSNKTSQVLLNQVVSIIEDNEDNEDSLIKTLKEDYIVRAQAVAYILDAKPEAVEDVDELCTIAELMSVDEIHIFNDEGEIYSGTEPKYYGYNFDSGEQMEYFKPMLLDRKRTMCQDVTPNTAEQKSMMYAITWNSAGDKMIQVGIEPVRLLEELRSNEISVVVANMPIYEGIDIIVADASTGIVTASTNGLLEERTLEDLNIDIDDTKKSSRMTTSIDGERSYCNIKTTGDYIVVVAYSVTSNAKNFTISISIEFVYLLTACLIIFIMFRRVIRANDERNAQMQILESVADSYNSMHLIDLEADTIKEYSARSEVSDMVDEGIEQGAAEIMEQLMIATTDELYRGEALEFTDMHTIRDRMKDKKIISEELVSKAIGWYRGSFITIETDDDGRPTKLIYVTQNIDKQKKKVEELLYKSNVDQLTGLYNRRAYEDNISERGDTVVEKDFVFVSLDVNGLKRVNDSMGHSAGDELLIGAAKCMKRCFGPYGRIYRTGGDEFVAMIFANDKQLGDIMSDFESVVQKWSGDQVKSLAISTGYVTKRENETASVHEMAEIADKRMYEAKARYYESRPEEKRRIY